MRITPLVSCMSFLFKGEKTVKQVAIDSFHAKWRKHSGAAAWMTRTQLPFANGPILIRAIHSKSLENYRSWEEREDMVSDGVTLDVFRNGLSISPKASRVDRYAARSITFPIKRFPGIIKKLLHHPGKIQGAALDHCFHRIGVYIGVSVFCFPSPAEKEIFRTPPH